MIQQKEALSKPLEKIVVGDIAIICSYDVPA